MAKAKRRRRTFTTGEFADTAQRLRTTAMLLDSKAPIGAMTRDNRTFHAKQYRLVADMLEYAAALRMRAFFRPGR